MMAEVSRVLDAYAPSQNEAQTEEDLVRPMLRLLGYEAQLALATSEGQKRPAYAFYRDRSLAGRQQGWRMAMHRLLIV